jgi:hypothetical protein
VTEQAGEIALPRDLVDQPRGPGGEG